MPNSIKMLETFENKKTPGTASSQREKSKHEIYYSDDIEKDILDEKSL